MGSFGAGADPSGLRFELMGRSKICPAGNYIRKKVHSPFRNACTVTFHFSFDACVRHAVEAMSIIAGGSK